MPLVGYVGYYRNGCFNKLYKEMVDVLGNENVIISALFITNLYKHNNRFIEAYQNTEIKDLVKIEKIVYNFPSIENFSYFDNDEVKPQIFSFPLNEEELILN